MASFKIEGKQVQVYPSAQPGRPVVYLCTFGHEGGKVYEELKKGGCPDFSLVTISDLDWNHDMAPWDCPPISRMDTPCTGGADDFLQILTEKILPEAEKNIEGEPAWRGISGYSLAGLFAVYAIYRTDFFPRVASMSGSLWFPGLKDYIFTHEPVIRPDAVYLSLGKKRAGQRTLT